MTPNWRWMIQKPWRLLACGFGSGLPRKAPGTWGTLGALLLWVALMLGFQQSEPLVEILPLSLLCVFFLLLFCLGAWACERTGQDLGVSDHGAMVWDEWLAMWAVLVFLPCEILPVVLAFLLFRFFDILKPFPISLCDRTFKNGWGVMLDDVIAAVYTYLTLYSISYFYTIF